MNWFLGIVVGNQQMSLAGLDPDMMSISSKIGGVLFGLYFALCGVVALLVAWRDRSPAGLGRILLISVAVVHALLGAFVWGLVGVQAFLAMIVVLTLVVLLLMTYDHQDPTATETPDVPGSPDVPDVPEDASPLTPPPAPSTP
nr:hypothetical protein [Streptomyces sp. SID12501]